jgi:hypothetical protein
LIINKKTLTPMFIREYENGTVFNEIFYSDNQDVFVLFKQMELAIFDFCNYTEITRNTVSSINLSDKTVINCVIEFTDGQMKISLTSKFINEDFVSTQVWQENSKWWSLAEKRIGDRSIIKGTLVK